MWISNLCNTNCNRILSVIKRTSDIESKSARTKIDSSSNVEISSILINTKHPESYQVASHSSNDIDHVVRTIPPGNFLRRGSCLTLISLLGRLFLPPITFKRIVFSLAMATLNVGPTTLHSMVRLKTVKTWSSLSEYYMLTSAPARKFQERTLIESELSCKPCTPCPPLSTRSRQKAHCVG